jgi:hypothetical protein
MGPDIVVRAEFPDGPGAIDRSADPCLVVVSLLAEAEETDQPWADQEARLVSRFRDLTSDPRVTCLLCTLFRHLPDPSGEDGDRRLITRIRRLNRLVAELSRDTGLLVVHLDRALADIGALALGADYRLLGPTAAMAAGEHLAAVILNVALEGVVPFERLDAAVAALATAPIPRTLDAEGIASPAPSGSIAPGKRPRALTGPEGVMLGVTSGRVPLSRALFMLSRSIARRGLAPTFSLALAGTRRLWRPRARGQR